jgi:hypothetical protein
MPLPSKSFVFIVSPGKFKFAFGESDSGNTFPRIAISKLAGGAGRNIHRAEKYAEGRT